MEKLNSKFLWPLVAVLVVTIGVGLYFGLGDADSNVTPPSLELEGGLQGFIFDEQGFYEFEQVDIDDLATRVPGLTELHGESIDRELKAGKRGIYYYIDDDISYEAILSSIDTEAGNKCLIATYLEEEFKIYPEGPYKDAALVDPSFIVPQGTPFGIVCRDDYNTWGLSSGDVAVSEYVEPDFAALEKGWHLLSFETSAQFEDAAQKCSGRIEKIFTQDGISMNDWKNMEELEKVLQPTDGDGVYHFVWFFLNDDESAETCVVSDDESPSQIEGLVAEAKDGAIKLTWEAATDNVAVEGYRVHFGLTSVDEAGESYDDSVDAEKVLEYEVYPVILEYDVSPLENDKTYYLSIVAYDAAGNESVEWADEVSATPVADPTVDPAYSPETGTTKALERCIMGAVGLEKCDLSKYSEYYKDAETYKSIITECSRPGSIDQTLECVDVSLREKFPKSYAIDKLLYGCEMKDGNARLSCFNENAEEVIVQLSLSDENAKELKVATEKCTDGDLVNILCVEGELTTRDSPTPTGDLDKIIDEEGLSLELTDGISKITAEDLRVYKPLDLSLIDMSAFDTYELKTQFAKSIEKCSDDPSCEGIDFKHFQPYYFDMDLTELWGDCFDSSDRIKCTDQMLVEFSKGYPYERLVYECADVAEEEVLVKCYQYLLDELKKSGEIIADDDRKIDLCDPLFIDEDNYKLGCIESAVQDFVGKNLCIGKESVDIDGVINSCNNGVLKEVSCLDLDPALILGNQQYVCKEGQMRIDL